MISHFRLGDFRMARRVFLAVLFLAVPGGMFAQAQNAPAASNVLAPAVLRTLSQAPEYRWLQAFYEDRRREEGTQWLESESAQLVQSTLSRLRNEASSAAIEDPIDSSGRRNVIFVDSSGNVRRLGSLVPELVETDELSRNDAAAIIARLILEEALNDGLLPPPAPSPAAQEALAAGVLSARMQDYNDALRHFEEARDLAPFAPEVYFNLGLAESNIPGRELRAIAWFGAYLAANPFALPDNAGAVREQMNRLYATNRDNLMRWLRDIETAAAQYSEPELSTRLYQAVILWIDAGEIDAAQRTGAQIPRANDEARWSQDDIAEAQLRLAAPPETSPHARIDWLRILDDDNYMNDCPLAAKLFVDFGGDMEDLRQNNYWGDTPIEQIRSRARILIGARNQVGRMMSL